MSKINLEELYQNKINSIDFGSNCPLLGKLEIIELMKEACKQTLELAAENADYHCTDSDVEVIIDKQSILNVINLIK